jgi:hypothetical protein
MIAAVDCFFYNTAVEKVGCPDRVRLAYSQLFVFLGTVTGTWELSECFANSWDYSPIRFSVGSISPLKLSFLRYGSSWGYPIFPPRHVIGMSIAPLYDLKVSVETNGTPPLGRLKKHPFGWCTRAEAHRRIQELEFLKVFISIPHHFVNRYMHQLLNI